MNKGSESVVVSLCVDTLGQTYTKQYVPVWLHSYHGLVDSSNVLMEDGNVFLPLVGTHFNGLLVAPDSLLKLLLLVQHISPLLDVPGPLQSGLWKGCVMQPCDTLFKEHHAVL